MLTVQPSVLSPTRVVPTSAPARVAGTLRPARAPDGAAGLVDTLLHRVARQEVEAFDELYTLTSRRVYGLVRKTLMDGELSAEITQEVFLTLWQSAAARFDPRLGSGLSWIMTLAHRRAVDKVRAEESQRTRYLRWSSKNQDVDYDEVADAVIQHSETESVQAVLAVLTHKQREAIHLAYYTGLTYTEVAARLDIPIPTAKTRIRDGIQRLRKALAEES